VSESRSKKAASVLAVLAMAVCGLAVAVRGAVPDGAVHDGAQAVCEVCTRAGVLLPDGGVVPPPILEVLGDGAHAAPLERAPGRSLAVVRTGGTLRPVLVQGVPTGRATVEELPEEPHTAQSGEAPPAFR
jgi:hypothetical protein